MAKLSKLSEENQELVDKIVSEVGLDNYMNIKCLNITKQKQVVKVARANPTTEYVGKCPDTVFIYIVEDIIDRLDEDMREMVIRDAINQIFYDSEKDKIVITPPQICVTVGGRQKYGDKLINALETCVHIQEEIEKEEKERKAAAKENKRKK